MEKYYRLAEGIEALIKSHHIGTKELAKYLEQYTTIKEQEN